MKNLTQKTLASILLAAIVVPAAFLSMPQKADAAAGSVSACIAGYAAAALSALPSVPQNILGVPKSQVGDTTQNVLTGGSANAISFNKCILQPLGSLIAITLIRNIGANVVNWVNSGFQGKPAFVTDFEGTLRDTADQAIGTFIEGSELGFLCNDFGFEIRLALALKYSQPFRQQATCTLTEIGNNISTNGGRGWDNLLSVTTEPQNNVYGAYLIAQTELTQRAARAVGIKKDRIAIGEGFLDYDTCDISIDSDTAGNAGFAEAKNAPKKDGWKNYDLDKNGISYDTNNQPPGTEKGKVCISKSVKTPGKIIANKLSSVLGQGEIQSAVAQEIDQVIAATLNQLAQKVIQGASGLLGLSKKRSSSSQSYISKYQSQYYGITSPTGTQADTGATSEIEDYQLNSYDQTSALLNDANDPNLSSINQVVNNTVNSATGQQQQQIASIADAVGPADSSTVSNAALLKPSSQSSGTNPSGANDGATQTSQYSRGSATAEDDATPWWEVNLGASKKIKEVRVWAVSDKPASQTLETFRVVIGGGAGQWSSDFINSATAANPIVVPVNQTGSTVRVEKVATPHACSQFSFDGECYYPLELAEVQVVEDVVAQNTTTNTPTSTNTTPATPADDTRTGTSTLSWSPAGSSSMSVKPSLNQELKLSADKSASDITVEIGLYKNGSLVPLLNVFNDDFDVIRGVSGGSKSSSQSVITPSIGAIRFRVSVGTNSSYSFTLKGSPRATAPTGSYSFKTTVSDSTGTVLPDKSQTISFSL